CDVELETGSGVVPFYYSPKGPVYSVQWAIGLDIFLNTDPNKVILATDNPNGGPFTRFSRIIAWLMSKKYRDYWLNERVHKWAKARSSVGDCDREYTMYEIAKITRANQAKVLGLSLERGHLGVGAIADIAVYDINPEEKDANIIERAFRYAKYTFKNGEIVVKDGSVVKEIFGDTIHVNVKINEELEKELMKDLKERFRRDYTVQMENYPVSDELARSWRSIDIDATDIN
ncbi:MAG TPA: formylmethanofuran dehydrogenase subunit A, partial [Methanothermococcus okinawensis]|nr:formylmethanofuran dehydrogenase subunit A [Methanothermococcus okinawensis]